MTALLLIPVFLLAGVCLIHWSLTELDDIRAEEQWLDGVERQARHVRLLEEVKG